MELLHTYSDGSKLYKMSAKTLLQVPIWKGNRIIDRNHVATIQRSIQGSIALLDSGYKTIQYTEYDADNQPIKTTYIIDGQHRISVVSDYFEAHPDAPDYFVTVTQLKVDSEADVIDYFNKINTVKPIQFEEDKNLILNKYIQALCKTYNGGMTLIRAGATKRPYLSVDKLREALMKRYSELKHVPVDKFVQMCKETNQQMIAQMRLERQTKSMDKIIQLDFALASDEKWKWIDQLCGDYVRTNG